MGFDEMMDMLSEEIKEDIINFEEGRWEGFKDESLNGKDAIRVTIGRFLTTEEKETMKKNPHFVGVYSVWQHRYAPEIKGSYFYVV